jgi:glycosyltransferase involved in cell wall biosynthesis
MCILDERRQPLVSVIIPAYQAAAHIRETLDSVFAQTYPNLEVVLVNDGSPDTEALEQAIRSYGERLIYIRQENRGPSGARNTAIRTARGKYIACLDSDDLYLPDHLANMVAVIKEKGLDLLYCDSFLVENGILIGRTFERERQILPVTFEKLLQDDCCVSTSGLVASRQAVIDAGLFDEHYRRCEDFDLWLRMSFRGAKMDLVQWVGVERRLLPTGLSADDLLLQEARIEIYRKTGASLPLSAAQQAIITTMVARNEGISQTKLVKRYLREGRYPEARVAAGKAAVLLQDRKSRRVALVVQIVPWAARHFLLMQEARLARKKARGKRVIPEVGQLRIGAIGDNQEMQESRSLSTNEKTPPTGVATPGYKQRLP